MSLMGMWRAVVDAFSGSCRRCPRCCWRRGLDRASFDLALPVGMLRRWLVRVHRVVMPVTGAESWTVVDGGWAPVEPVERYLGYLAGIERSRNTLRAYAHGLRLWFEFLGARRLGWDSVGIEDVSRFVAWLRAPADNVIVFDDTATVRSAAPTPSGPSCVWSYAAAACSAPKASCGPTGATTASSPTATTSTPSPLTQTAAATPQSSSPSETSKRAPGSAAAPPDDSPPTAPGSPAACSRTTSPAWTARLGRAHPTRQLTVAATIPNRFLTVPGRLVNHSGRHRLRLPLNWPWQNTFTTALQHIRNLPLLI